MRRLLIIAAALVFSSLVLALSVRQSCDDSFRNNLGKTAMAQGNLLEFETNGGQEGTPAGEEVDYQLTWPGILPGHILYPVKMLRDKVWLFLAYNPLKKAELYLKLADKRLWSADLLYDKGKSELAIETATKAEKYLERAIDQERVAREAGEDTGSFLERIELASQKHEQVLIRMRERAGESGGGLNELVGYPQRVREQVRGRRGQEE